MEVTGEFRACIGPLRLTESGDSDSESGWWSSRVTAWLPEERRERATPGEEMGPRRGTQVGLREKEASIIIGPGILRLVNVYERRNAGGCGRKRGTWKMD